VTVKTVESHLRSVFTKLPASSRAEVARAVLRERERAG
jgi:DNA-binding NarL/FixJ family response regulator